MNDIKELFDFREYAYFYHITGNDLADGILEEGLLVDGTNILDVDNILFTTAIPITPDMIDTFEEDILDQELHEDNLRGVSEMVIIGCPKDEVKFLVDQTPQHRNGKDYEGIIHPTNIMGYFNLEHEFIPNENYDYGTNSFYNQTEEYQASR